jgi:hypothetical protein
MRFILHRYFAERQPELYDCLFNHPNNGNEGFGEAVSVSTVLRHIDSKKDPALAERHVKATLTAMMNKNDASLTSKHNGSAGGIAYMRRIEQSVLLATGWLRRILANITAHGADRQDYEPVIEQTRTGPTAAMPALHIPRDKVLCMMAQLLSLAAVVLTSRSGFP